MAFLKTYPDLLIFSALGGMSFVILWSVAERLMSLTRDGASES